MTTAARIVDPMAAEAEAVAEMRAFGLMVPDGLETDRLVRVEVEGHRKGNKAGWYRYHSDSPQSAAYGHWYEAETHTWCARGDRELTPDEREAQCRRIAETERMRRADKAAKETAAAKVAASEWDSATEDFTRVEYLARKRAKPYGVRAAGDSLLIPARDIDGKLWSRQTIDGAGKWFLDDGRIAGCFHVLGSLDGAKRALLCEGYATAATLHEATGLPVIMAFSAGNLEPVAKAVHARHPDLRLVICADDDYKRSDNPGLTKARAAAKAVDGILAVPKFGEGRPDKATDYNDLMFLRSLSEVKTQIEQAIAASVPPLAADRVIEVFARPVQPAIPTGFETADEAMGGGCRGVTLVCGSTGVGKSNWAIQVAVRAARDRSVVLFETELPERQAFARVGAQVLNMGGWRKLYEGGATTGRAIAEALRSLRLRIVELRTVEELSDSLQRVTEYDGAPPFAVIDYLQSFGRSSADDDRRQTVSRASDLITSWTRVTGGSALVVSSVSRAMYQTDDKLAPEEFLAAAKESGDLEFDASTVLFLAVPRPPMGGRSEGRLVIAKSRFGACGVVGVSFDGPTGRFAEVAGGGLTDRERAVLTAIEGGASGQGAIAKAAGIRKADVGHIIRALRSRGLMPGSGSGTSDGEDQANFSATGTSSQAVPAPEPGNGFPSVGRGSRSGTGPHGWDSGSHPVGVKPEPEESPDRGNPDEDLT
jgi:phage/plasmid primase-like uncharacterized protein/KaiC/GvpD/RAD55 family RecA-like ATPase